MTSWIGNWDACFRPSGPVSDGCYSLMQSDAAQSHRPRGIDVENHPAALQFPQMMERSTSVKGRGRPE